MTEIHELDPVTVDKIAAGEVVERPASVVKELVENSLDADAGRVEVTVERGGKDLVRVRDDGVGMTEEAVRTAVRQHTTSKIDDIADLESGVGTLGFRGEALHTIGAVSRLAIRTKPRGAEVGTELRMAGGEVVSVEPTGCPEGTTVEVTDLFYNTPAREKYLGRDRTEFGRVNDVATKYALAYPNVAVSLVHDGREVFATTGRDDLRATIQSVYGREVAEAMVPVGAGPDAGAGNGSGDGAAGDESGDEAAGDESGDEAGGQKVEDEKVGGEKVEGEKAGGEKVGGDERGDGPLRRVGGYVSHPETTRSSRDYVSAFVNGRYVQSRVAREAVVEAYGDQLAADRYPFAVLFLEVPAGDVDVNVHPRKREVRFADEAAVREQVREAVGSALLDHGLLRSGAPRGRSAPAEVEVAPEGADDAGWGSGRTDDADAAPGRADDDRPPERTDEHDRPAGTGRSRDGVGEAVDDATGSEARDRATEVETREHQADDRVERAGAGAEVGRDETRTGEANDTTGTGSGSDGGDAGPAARDAHPDPDHKFRDAAQRTLDGEPATGRPAFETLPPLRVLGQYDDTYVVAAGPDGLVLIDQHAADERVNYERLRERVGADAASQGLAEPVELELTAGEAALFDAYEAALAELGFEATRSGERSVAVTAVPAVLADALDPGLLRDVLSGAIAEDEAGRPVADRADELLADLACSPSITGNTSLTEGSVVELLAALDGCENPYACPHGRPVLVEIGDDEIGDRFERDYPGHGGRRDG